MSGFGVHTLALLVAIGLAGPLLASLPGLRLPVVIGELLAGVVVGKTGFGIVDHTDPTFTLLANVGFALVTSRMSGSSHGTWGGPLRLCQASR